MVLTTNIVWCIPNTSHRQSYLHSPYGNVHAFACCNTNQIPPYKNNNTCCGYRIEHIIQSLIHYCIYCLSTFYTVVFFICIHVVALNNRIYVSVIYVLCLYECSWVILLTTCGYKTIVSPMEHTFVFDMKTTTGFHLWHSTTRYNHRITFTELIYLRSTVVLICWVYKYTTMDINTPYRRFKSILWWFFVIIYVLYSTDFFIYIYLYVYIHGILPVDTYISHPYFYMYLCSYIDTYICFFKALHIDRTCVRHKLHDRLQPANRCSI